MKTAPTVDTRLFLTLFLVESPSIREKTKRMIEQLEDQNALVPTIVLHEVYKFEHETQGAEVAALRTDSIVKSNFTIVDLDTRIALSAARLRVRHRGLPTADSIIAATSIERKSNTVISDDPHFKAIKEISVEWIA